jgi:phosphoribosylanthranilate isomerase
VVDIVHQTGLRAAQLHGFESPNEARWVRQRVRTSIKAFPAGDPRLDHADDWGADVIMIDSATPGSGQVFDWSLAEGAPPNRRLLICGGLTPQNVGDAIRQIRPWGVDVSTGVESSPGHKDARKLKAFIDATKAAGREVEAPPYVADTTDRPFDWADDLS